MNMKIIILLVKANKEKTMQKINTGSRPKQKQTKARVSYVDNSCYNFKNVKEVIIDEKEGLIHISSERLKGSVTLRENVSIPMKVVVTLCVDKPDVVNYYVFRDSCISSHNKIFKSSHVKTKHIV